MKFFLSWELTWSGFSSDKHSVSFFRHEKRNLIFSENENNHKDTKQSFKKKESNQNHEQIVSKKCEWFFDVWQLIDIFKKRLRILMFYCDATNNIIVAILRVTSIRIGPFENSQALKRIFKVLLLCFLNTIIDLSCTSKMVLYLGSCGK